MDKKKLRKDMLLKRDEISSDVREIKSNAIKERLQRLEVYQQAYTVLYYVSFRTEVETHGLIKEALKEKRVLAPKVEKNKLLIKQITDFDELEKGYFNILEPKESQPSVEIRDVSLIIVPAVAFDKNRFRLGYGGGFYDRLFAEGKEYRVKGSEMPISIGLAFEEQIVDELPTEAHDQKVDFIVTDKRII